jgi:2',3'-cyclic-nucleotide 2'-phosphodiesterase (5'-nucleotidase family)
MRLLLPLWLAVVGSLPFSAPRAARAPAPAPASDTLRLRVLAINDFHGALEPQVWPWSGGRLVGGAAALKAWFDRLAAACRCATVRLDAGDEMQGTPVSNLHFGRPVILAFNAFGVDAAAIGNHEFDWSVDTLRARMAGARYPLLAANLADSAGARPAWVRPWTLIRRGGVTVAVIGLALRATPETTAPGNVRGLVFGDGAAAVRRVLPEARAAADFVIVVAHEGAFCAGVGGGAGRSAAAAPLPPAACHGGIVDVARGLDSGSVDLIVSGHTHSLVNTVVNGIPIVQARSSGAGIAVVDLVRVAGAVRAAGSRIETPYADRVPPDPALADSVARYARAIAAITGRPVARIAADLRRHGDEYGLGRLVADAHRAAAHADVALVNNGGIRADLAAGVATYGDLFRVEPFQNRLVRLAVSGAVLRQALERAVSGADAGAHVSGLAVWYDPGRPPGGRIVRVRLADGADLDAGRTYTLAVSNFLAAGGGGYVMLRGAPAEDAGVTDLDALVGYLAALPQPVRAPAEARLHRVEGGP